MHVVNLNTFGNPSSIHRFGQSAKAVVEKARRQIALVLNCSPSDIIFTGSGTETNNMVLLGSLKKGDHFITSSIEHSSIYRNLNRLKKSGVDVTLVDPDSQGTISARAVENALQDNTQLVSVMYANNELGTINPILEIAEVVNSAGCRFHSDAVQAFGKVPIFPEAAKISYLSLSAHKLYGPKGIGALYIRQGFPLDELIAGGGQEKNSRAGTENVPAIAGFGLAAEIAAADMLENAEHLNNLKNHFLTELDKYKIHYTLQGTNTLPGFMCVTFPAIKAQELVIRLDLEGIAISAGSACSSGTLEPSQVLSAIGLDNNTADCTVRITPGRFNTLDEMELIARSISGIIQK